MKKKKKTHTHDTHAIRVSAQTKQTWHGVHQCHKYQEYPRAVC